MVKTEYTQEKIQFNDDQKSTYLECSIHIGSISSNEFGSPKVKKSVVEEHVQVEEGIFSSI